MTISLRKIAMDMDSCAVNTSISLDKIGRLHRWGADTFQSGVPYRPEVLSLRDLGHKHSRSLKFLWLNTYMLPSLKLDVPFVYSGQVFEGAPAIGSRAYEIGETIKKSGYDVAALCEVFSVQSKDTLLSAWESTPYWVRGPGEGSVSFEMSGISILTVETISSGLLTVLPGNYGHLSDGAEKFEIEGDPKRDADAWSNKGILEVIANTGFNTKLEIYSTHLIFGGGLIGDFSSEDRYKIQRIQLSQLVSFIKKNRNPSNFTMVAGDFNIYADEAFYQELRGRMEEELGLEDVWARYAIPRYGAKVGRTDNPSKCTPDNLPCGQYADDSISDNPNEKPNEEARIDYIFIQKPCESHDINVDISRPRRRLFPRKNDSPGYDQIQYLSDHAGIELTLFISSKIRVPASPRPGD